MTNNIIPIFYACDDRFLNYAIVSIKSLMENSKGTDIYRIHILHTGIPLERQSQVIDMECNNFEIVFEDVSDYLEQIAHKCPLRDYYSKTTYYRFFIADMHPEFDKAIYIDSDTVVQHDIKGMFSIELDDNYVGACHDTVITNIDVFGEYSEKCLGVDRNLYFNAGILLINCRQFREKGILGAFTEFLGRYEFVVAQDQDYMNVLCKDHVLILDQRWNTSVFTEIPYPIEEAGIVHYNMFNKPWHYRDCPHSDLFFRYSDLTFVNDDILKGLETYTDDDRARDAMGADNLVSLAISETNRKDNYLNRLKDRQYAKDRVEILDRINEFEREGKWDVDVEDDPPGKVLMPDDISYTDRGMKEYFMSKVAFKMAHILVNRLIKSNKLIIKDIVGLSNLADLESGAVITCNHFNAFDSFAIQLAYEAADQRHRTFYRVIREGNYTSFPGFYGFLMRHCNTLPLSSNRETMKKFMDATEEILQDGNFILVYPEQSMWWNYRKPKPLKRGAFVFAAKSNVPVLPCFITMKDSNVVGDDGFFVQEYTIHIEKPIYPNAELPSQRAQAEDLRERNYKVWKEIYEREYQTPLTYLDKEEG